MPRFLSLLLSSLFLVNGLDPAIAEEKVDYLKQVKPIFVERCFACHGALKQESSFRLDTAELLKQGGENGPGFLPGNAAKSQLLERISVEDLSVRMPPEGKALTAEEISLISLWIDQGAVSPRNEQPEEDPRSHWAFLAPVRSSVPKVLNGGWVRNPIDVFVAAKHEQMKLVPAAEASKNILLRRVYLDLTGLPPTREQLHEFLADESPEAYEKVVDELLDSPSYGERWARHWMDVWRYSDWYGRRQVNDVRNSYPHIWRWRDWIIQSLNDDKGYDRMVMEMLAADEISPEDDRAIAATGFIVRNWFSLNYDQWMKDIVEHTGKAFLGLRLNCAHCHDHKYDPISQEEYFRFRAFFEPLELRHDRVPGGPYLTKYKKYTPSSGGALKPIEAGLARVFDTTVDAKTYMYRLGDARDRFDRGPVKPAALEILGDNELSYAPVNLPAKSYYPGLKEFVRRDEIGSHKTAIAEAKAEHELAVQVLTKAEQEYLKVQKSGPKASVESASDQKGRSSQNGSEKSESPGDQLESARNAVERAKLTLQISEAKLKKVNSQMASLEARIAADDVKYLGKPGDVEEVSKAASRAERTAALHAAEEKFIKAEQTLRDAGHKAETTDEKSDEKTKLDAAKKKAETAFAAAKKAVETAKKATTVESTQYQALSPKYPEQSSGRRKALAEWIANEKNPLTARVAVNHIWMRHFGRPLVESVFDFGRAGKKPTHPKLLDWLSVELMNPTVSESKHSKQWSMKHIHRLIVTSSTYRMHSQVGQEIGMNREVDKDNRFLWRYQPRRMEAEVVRDSILHAAGVLVQTIGGQDIDPKQGPTRPRRSIYFSLYPEAGGRLMFAGLFDPPDPGDCYRRTESIVPQQALAMTNSKLSLNQSRVLARSLTKKISVSSQFPGENRTFIEVAYEQMLSRQPTEQEEALCLEFLKKQSNLFERTDPQELKGQPEKDIQAASIDVNIRARESLIRALFSHNDFVMIQ